MALRALIFDVDGTLADTEKDGHRVAFNRAFSECGLNWDWDPLLYGKLLAVTGGKERILHYLKDYHPDFQAPSAKGDLDTFIADLHLRETHYYLDLLKSGSIPLRPGVKRILQEARESKLHLAIATTSTPASVEALLQITLGHESLHWFEVIATGDIVPTKKPAPDIFNYVLKKMNLHPTECLVIEDSRNGLLSAHAAGCRTLITVNGYTKNQDFSDAWLVVDQLGDAVNPVTLFKGDWQEGTYIDVPGLIKAFG